MRYARRRREAAELDAEAARLRVGTLARRAFAAGWSDRHISEETGLNRRTVAALRAAEAAEAARP